jgi:transcription antitermination factor NusG
MGTSMCGMNSDRVFTTVSKRAKKNFQKNKERSLLGLMKKYLPPSSNNGSTVLGGVIIAIQRTQHDALASLRIYSKIDKVMILLLAKLNIDDSRVTQSYNLLNGISSSDRNKEENESDDYIRLTIPNKYRLDEHVLKVKYDENGHLQDDGDNNSFILDLSPGAKVRIVGGPYDGDLGEVSHINKGGNYAIQFMHAINKTTQVKKPFMRVLGWWWVQAAVEGTVTTLPVVNCL